MKSLSLVVAALLLSCPSIGQSPLTNNPEGPAFLTVGDFNQDGRDDIIAWGWWGNATYWGTNKYPYLVRDKLAPWDSMGILLDAPLYQGGYVYVPILDVTGIRIQVYGYNTTNSSWYLANTSPVSLGSGASINSVKVCPFHRDIDKDNKPDVIFVYSSNVGRVGKLGVGLISPLSYWFSDKSTITNQPKDAEIVDIFPCENLGSLANPADYQVFLTGPNSISGFGMVLLEEFLNKITKKLEINMKHSLWAVTGPDMYKGWHAVTSPIVYGSFGILPVPGRTYALHLNAPLIPKKYSPQEALYVFTPTFAFPYANKQYDWLPLYKSTQMHNQCTVDFDGDGIEETGMSTIGVIIGSNYDRSLLYIGDPSYNRKYLQAFWYPTDKRPSLGVYDVAAGDFDGDGDPDVVVALIDTISGELSYLQCNRKNGKGKPALTKIY